MSSAVDAAGRLIFPDTLESRLLKATDNWRLNLPGELSSLTTQSVLATSYPRSSGSSAPQPKEVTAKLEASLVPSAVDWHDSLIRHWRWVSEIDDERHDFFKLDESIACSHLRDLATQLAEVCAGEPRLAQRHSLYLLERIDAEVRRRDGEVPLISVTSDDIIAAFDRMSSWATSTLANPENWVERPEEEGLRQLFEESRGRFVCVLGTPGSGKTTLVARIARAFSADGYVTVAIKADSVDAQEGFAEWARRTLGLDIRLEDAIAKIACERRIVVVVDQLDALSSLVDLTSARLNDLLALICRCAETPNVAVVCSCREFEYRYDTRLASMDASHISLTLPDWESVAAQLKKEGIKSPERWPNEFREVLRVPQHFQIYIKRFHETANMDAFASYQCLLDDLWERKLGKSEHRDLAYRLTEVLMRTESLWAPAVQFEPDLPTIDQLIAVELLQRQDRRIGFRHQTLLEHAKARLFTRSGQSLAEHVFERQDAIFVRPTIWTVLGYLRDADRAKYHEELRRLLAGNLRLHVRYLLIEFLGQLSDPDEVEVVSLTGRLANAEDRLRVLLAIRGKERWFRALRSTHFPTIMGWKTEDQWPMVGVIGDAWEFARRDCLDLIKKYWITDPAKDSLTYRALRNIDHWDQETVDMACRLIHRSEDDGDRLWWAEELVNVVSADQPKLAPQVFAAVTSRKSVQARSESAEPSWHNSPLESTQGWHELPAVAEAAPLEFLKLAWPWFVETCVKFHGGPAVSSVVHRYRGYLFALDRENGRPHYPLLTAVIAAVEQTAKCDPSGFLAIINDTRGIDNAPVQRVLCRGFTAAASNVPTAALDFLCEDPRRFQLGCISSGYEEDTIALISTVAEHLDSQDRQRLEEAILGWSQYKSNDDLGAEEKNWDREARLRLLKAIPSELLSTQTAKFVQSETDALPDWDRRRQSGGFGSEREIPPLSKEAMESASDEQVLDALRGPYRIEGQSKWVPEKRIWERPGGAGSVLQELEELAKTDPSRVLGLIPRLVAEGNESAAAQLLGAFAKSETSVEALHKVIRQVAQLYPGSEELREKAGYVLYVRCEEGKGLPDDLCETLEHWLSMPWAKSERAIQKSDSEVNSEDDREPTSVLWGPGGGMIETDQSFFPLLALTYGYLSRTPPNTQRWLALLDRLIDSDISVDTWKHYARELRWVGITGCDREHGVSVINKLFRRHPELALTTQGILLVALVGNLLPPEFVREFLERLCESDERIHRQAYGELLTLIALRGEPHEWCKAVLERELTKIEDAVAESEYIAVGIGFAAAQLWDESITRLEAGRLLCRLIPGSTKKVAHAIGTVFWAAEDFPADDQTDSLLKAIASHPASLSGRFVPDLVEHLTNLLPHMPHTVLGAARAVVEGRGSELGSISSALFTSGPHLVNIAMTLQRFPETRSDGLALFESLLKLGLDDAFAVLNDIDIRPASVQRREARSRRRPPRKTPS